MKTIAGMVSFGPEGVVRLTPCKKTLSRLPSQTWRHEHDQAGAQDHESCVTGVEVKHGTSRERSMTESAAIFFASVLDGYTLD
jgi:hypothetical protein